MKRAGPCAAVAMAVVLTSFIGPAEAHQADTSYLRVQLEEDRIETVFTLDLHVLGRIVTVDLDGDETITRDDLEKIAPEVQTYLSRTVLLSLDDGAPSLGRPLRPRWPPETEEARAGAWAQTLVDLPFTRTLETTPSVLTLRLTPWAELGPSHTNLARIGQTGFEEIEVAFTLDEPDFDYFTETPPSAARNLARFVHLGAEHIWGGFDHVLFLVALLVVSRLRELLQIVTAFTVAHSITLALAVLDLVEVPSRWVEAGIAATIVWVAVQNLRGHGGTHRWRLTFAFGLVHGFGFAGVLRELDLAASGVLRSLAGFNLGVELGQIALVAGLFPVFALLTRTRIGPRAVAGISATIGLAGAGWLVERAFGFHWMPI